MSKIHCINLLHFIALSAIGWACHLSNCYLIYVCYIYIYNYCVRLIYAYYYYVY